MIYLDSAAKTKPLACAIEAFLAAPQGNPSSEHAAGKAARDALEDAREKIAECVGASADKIYFCSTATEAASWIAKSATEAGYHLHASPFEHHAVLNNIEEQDKYGSPQLWFRMLANNEVGTVDVDVPNLYKDTDSHPLIASDATAAMGHIPIRCSQMKNVGYVFADSIKFGGLPGAAFIVKQNYAPISPLIRGGGQERGMRSGTENVPAICAMAAALEWQTEHMEENTKLLLAMRDVLFRKLSEIEYHRWNTPLNKPILPHILNISFDGVDAHALTLLLSNEGIMVSAGAACSNGLNEPSHVIMAMYNDEARARSAIRISLSHDTTVDECVEAAQKIAEAVAYLRDIS